MSTTPHVLANGNFFQDWSNAGLITVNDNWAGVASIVGYLGDIDAGSPTGVNPTTLTGAALGDADVIANQTNPNTATAGGVAEFVIADPTVALNGSGTADAPSLVLYMDASGRSNVRLQFDARDIDGSVDNANQQLAVQYRLGSGTWTNAPGGYAADVTTANAATQVTPFDVLLPAEVNGRADLQIRILTTNAAGNDEWVGVDNIQVSSEPVVTGEQSVGFAPSSLSMSVTEGDTGTKFITFTVQRTGGTEGDVNFVGTVSLGQTDAGDFAGNEAPVFAGVIEDDQTSTTVRIEIAGDAVVEPDESFTVQITTAENQDGLPITIAAGASTATGTIVNDEVTLTKISAVQGTGAASTVVGQTVTIEGIVVGDFQNGDADAKRDLGGFYVMEEVIDQDGNVLSSEAIFVASNTDVQVGDKVRITGQVVENFGQTQLGLAGSGSVPAPTVSVVEADAVADVNTLAVTIDLPSVGTTTNQNGQFQPDLERYEGMLVTFSDTLTVTEQFNLDRFNEIKLVAGDRPSQFTHENDPSVAGNQAHLQELGSRTIAYDDGLNVQNAPISNLDGFAGYNTGNAPRMGDTIDGLTGVLDYQWAGNSASGSTWRVRSIEDGDNTFQDSATPRPAEPEDVGGRLQVGSFNVLNYFKTLNTISDPNNSGDYTEIGMDPRGANSAAEFARQTDKLVDVLMTLDADVLALIEIENDFLAGSSGNAIEYLVGQLNARIAGTENDYAWVNPGEQFVGGDAIAVGFIYKPSMVTVSIDTTVEMLDDSDLAGLGLGGLLGESSIGHIFNGANTSRVALAVTFEEVSTGEEFTAIANHLKSKSGTGTGADADQGDGQGNWQNQRELAAEALTTWAASDPTGSNDSDVMLLGDFNAYFKEDTIDVVKAGGFENLLERTDNPYSYVFDGQVGALDYAFANGSLASQVTGVTEWHINADEADALDYNTDFGRDPAIFDADTPVRVSDHDPVLVGLDLSSEVVEEPAFTLQLLHLSDGEAGLLATQTAANLAALVDAFDDDYANTLILSGGDNWLPGPFNAAGTDPSVLDELNAVTGSTMTGTIPIAAADIAIHNIIGVEASALGNHDFDLGSTVLATSLNAGAGWVGAQFVSVSANLVVGPTSPYYGNPEATDSALNAIYRDTVDYQYGQNNSPTATEIAEASTMKGKIAPAAVITKGGEKIGLVGATTQLLESISSPSGAEVAGFPGGNGANGELDNMDLLAAHLQPIIDEMIAEGINKIILMSHLQVIDNEKLLASKLKGVDVILSAGSNTRLGDADDEAATFPGHSADFADTYPLVITNAEGKNTLIVNTDNEYTYLGRLVVDFDANGDIIVDSLAENQAINGAYASTEENVAEAWNTTVDNLDETAFADGTKGDKVKTLTDAVQAVISEKDGNVYGYSDVYLEGERNQVRNEETNLGDLTADANGGEGARALKAALGDAAETEYVVSIKNGGGIRAQIGTLSAPDPVTGEVDKLPPDGGVSQLDVENSLRFNNKLMAFDTTAAGLKAILEHGVGLLPNQGRFPQIGGVAFSYDPDLPAGSRVTDIALIDDQGNTVVRLYDNGLLLPAVPSKITVVTLNFMADGGDGYPMKANGTNFRYLLDDGSFGPVLPNDSDLDLNPPANAMSEQKALENYMRENHATPETAYDQADTTMAGDERIQNLNFRSDTVLTSVAEQFLGTGADDVFDGGAEADTATGNAGEDVLNGHGGNDTLRGGGDDDILVGGVGNDDLQGGSGSDTLFGGEQNDDMLGGRGNDDLQGGDGSDTYTYEEGDGSDTITEGAGQPSDFDVLSFGDIAREDVVMHRHGNDVEVVLGDGSVITLKNQFNGAGGVDAIWFADGSTLGRSGIIGGLENRGPVADDDTLADVAEDTASVLVPFSALLDGDTDADLDTLMVIDVDAAEGGTAVVDTAAGGIRFTPAANYHGPASFIYTVIDGRGGSAQATASFTITSVDDLPQVTTPVTVTLDEDTAATGQVQATDADGDDLSYAVKQGSGPAHGQVTIDADTGAWSYTPAGDYNGADSFTVLVSDGDDVVEAVVNLDIDPVNDAPVAVDDLGSVGEDEVKLFDLVGNDTDIEDGRPILVGFDVTDVAGITLPAAQAEAAFSIENGQLKFAPDGLFDDLAAGQSATVTISYTVADSAGLQSTAEFVLTVEGQDDANVITGNGGDNVLFGTGRTDIVDAGGGADVVFGRGGHDVIDGGNGSDILLGGAGNDVIDGGAGRDMLFGGAGADRLNGGEGNDVLSGEGGADVFVFMPRFGNDTVLDFRINQGDTVELDASVFADFAALQAGGALTQTSAGVEIEYTDGGTLLLAGVNAANLTADDFRFS